MQQNITLKNGDKIEISRSVERIESLVPPQKYDPKWIWTDKMGHTHKVIGNYEVSGVKIKNLGWYWCDTCLDKHDEEIIVCSVCEDEVPKPPMVHDPDAPTHIFGPLTIKLIRTTKIDLFGKITNEEYLTEEEYNQYLQENMNDK